MKDYIISMFIDDELSLDEKIQFIEQIHNDQEFKNETVDLLMQEKELRSSVVKDTPPIRVKERAPSMLTLLRPVGAAIAAAAVVLFIFLFALGNKDTSVPYRFVIYQPDAVQAEITGSFTEWEKVKMSKVGKSGYWEANLNLPEGEHKYAYILNGNEMISDPSITIKETDDFGGENSILYVGRNV